MARNPIRRDPTQTMVAVSISKELLELLDRCTYDLDTNRSKVVRRAISEELKRLGYSVDDDAVRTPSRTGKGGKPTHKKKPVAKRRRDYGPLPTLAEAQAALGLKPGPKKAAELPAAEKNITEPVRRRKVG